MASSLFNLVAQAKQYAQRNVMARAAARRLEQSANAYANGRKSRWQLEQDLKAFQDVAGKDTLQKFERSGGTARYGVSTQAANILRGVTSSMGKIGKVVQSFFDRRTSGYQADQVRAATQLLKMTSIEDAYEATPQYRQVVEAAIESLEDHGWSVTDTMQTVKQSERFRLGEQPGTKQRAGSLEDSVKDNRLSIHQSGRQAAIDEEKVPRMSKKHFTAKSSNVYSFQYDYLTSTLYVQYKAPVINQSAVTNYVGSGGLPSMAGEMGRTIQGKSESPGALYAYFDVPIKIFKRLITAGSAGKEVWESLRIRGTVYGHKFRYSLVAGAMVPGEGGKEAYYVPRRAVKKGFQSRSVAVPGQGPRRYVGSTLPQDLRGHQTIKDMRHRPSRGVQPNRGRPDPPSRG